MLSKPIPQPKPKPGPAHAAAKRARRSLDELESQKVRERSAGRCEVWVQCIATWKDGGPAYVPGQSIVRCDRRATEVMHLLGGKNRGRGQSALAEHKLHGCHQCHRDIDGDLGGKKLVRFSGGMIPHYTDVYRRIE